MRSLRLNLALLSLAAAAFSVSVPQTSSATSITSCSLGRDMNSSLIPYSSRLESEATARRLLNPKGQAEYIKFSLDWKDAEKTYFQDTLRYEFHFPFLQKEIPAFQGLSADLYERYLFSTTEKRLTAGAVYFAECAEIPEIQGKGLIGFTVYFRDAFPVDEVLKTYEVLKKAIPFATDRIVFVFERKKDLFQNKKALATKGLPSMSLHALLSTGTQPMTYNTGVSYGYLKTLSPEAFALGEYTSRDILVLNQVPLDIGPLSGVITSEPQSPHSHVILRATNQGIPDLYLPDAANHPSVIKYSGQLVEFRALSDGTFTIQGSEELGEAELMKRAESYFSSRVPKLPTPKRDLSVKDFFFLAQAKAAPSLVSAYGAKGTNFALLDQALRQNGRDRTYFDGSLLIPFAYYEQHIAQILPAGICKKAAKECASDGFTQCETAQSLCLAYEGKTSLKSWLESLNQAPTSEKIMSEASYRKSVLAFARALIEKLPLPADFEQNLKSVLAKLYSPTTRIRFRSSTNAEDLPGLNGAGLYTSKSGCLGDEENEKDVGSACQTPLERSRLQAHIEKLRAIDAQKHTSLIAEMEKDLVKSRPIAKGIRGVYASLWNEKAFLHRDYYRISHSQISMGVLVHPAFVDESANGVALIEQVGGVLNADVVVQADDISVTNPVLPHSVPERFRSTVVPGQKMSPPSYLSRSNLTPAGQTVLSSTTLQELMEQLAIVDQTMRHAYPGSKEKTYDVEVIFSAEKTVLVKQARPLARNASPVLGDGIKTGSGED